MPGIVGLVTRRPREHAEPELVRMIEALRHEPCYVTGTWIDETLGLYVGWTVRKNAFADGMPLRNERGDVVLVFSGEEYPDPGTAGRLRARGHRLDAAASYLVHLYEEDRTFPASLNGRFHGLLADRSRETAMLFDDRYGMHRLYYHQGRDAFYFAAEAKAILEVRPELRRIDARALGEVVTCGCALENRSLFEGIHVLPGGAAWTFRQGRLEDRARYFEPREWEEQDVLEPEAYYQRLREVFARNLPRYFASTEPIAMSLTGGLDTRMILAWRKAPAGSLPCYTFGGSLRDSRDVRVARAVARACGQTHQVIRVGDEFLSGFPRHAERTVYLADGCADVSRAPDLYLNENARDLAPVRLTGNYGSEVLRGVRAFRPVIPRSGLFDPTLRPLVQAAAETYRGLLRGHPLSFIVFRQAPWHHYGLLALEQTQVSVRSPYLDDDLVRTSFRAPSGTLASPEVCLRLIAEGEPALARIRTDRGLAGPGGPLAALAARVVQEASFRAEYVYDYGMPQWMARLDRAVAPLQPGRLFLGRHKFAHFRVWYRGPLAGYVRDVLLDPRARSRPYLDGRRLEAIVAAHTSGRGNYTSEIHQALTLELIHRLFVDAR
jgi:asparagine synthase (glutamine-hydrolysing)